MRRLSTVGLLLAASALLLVALPAGGATAPRQQPPPARAAIDVAEVSGFLDSVVAAFVDGRIREAERSGAPWLVVQVNSRGAVVGSERAAALVERVRTARVPIAVWVGPSGARAQGAAAQIAAVADQVGIAPGGRLGRLGEPLVDPARFRAPFRRELARLRDGTVGAADAGRLGLAARPAPTVGDLVVNLDGVRTRRIQTDRGPRRTPLDQVRFVSLPLLDQLMHTVASPPVAYLLLVIGMALILLELFTAGVGIAGVVGAVCFLLGGYGLAGLPTRPWAVGLLGLAMFGFAVDIQTGVPRVWSAVAAGAFLVGSVLLYDGLSLPWITLLVGVAGTVAFMIGALPSLVRSRFSTPTIGRAWMVGEEGEAVADVAPDGVVRVRGALWRARTNRATPIGSGVAVRVVEVDGLLLEVEPLEGGARDHRERRRSRPLDAEATG
ncbi:MAG: hypothetical protein HYX34_00420 [Actinobacteria bacterium]|nr:hypothetical protein [Actinomycetota bacterium]